MTSRERVRRSVTFQGPDRIPLSNGIPSATWEKYGDRLKCLVEQYPGDFGGSGWQPGPDSPEHTKLSETEWVDEWGVIWQGLQSGLMGIPMGYPLADWNALKTYQVPKLLHGDFSKVPDALAPEKHDKWVSAYGGRLFEQMQWLRGTDNLMLDLADPPRELYELRDRIVERYLEVINHWMQYDIDAMAFEDDWGSQLALLISPKCWREFFKPAYERLFAPVLAAGKVVSFHTDGIVWDILPDFMDLGVTYMNVQYSLLGLERLGKECGGKICFHCDLEGQFFMPFAKPEEVRDHVRQLVQYLGSDSGGFVFDTWVTPDVPWENIEAMFAAFAEFCNW